MSADEDTWVKEIPFDSAMYLNGAQLESQDVQNGQAPIALFLAGGPLTGKTTTLNQLLAGGDEFIPQAAVRIEPDRLRWELPEFQAGMQGRDAGAAANVYEET